MNFDNKYGNEIEIKNMIVNDFHEYMFNYFVNNPDKHDLKFIFAGLIYGLTKYENDAVINNKLYNYIIDNIDDEGFDENMFNDDTNIIDFVIGLVLIIPFGGIIDDNAERIISLVNEQTNKYIKIEVINDNKINLKFKPEKLLNMLDEGINFKFKQQ